jgi:hypothetical protein
MNMILKQQRQTKPVPRLALLLRHMVARSPDDRLQLGEDRPGEVQVLKTTCYPGRTNRFLGSLQCFKMECQPRYLIIGQHKN